MTQILFSFNRVKAIEAILYISSHISDPTKHSISKLLYFADKTSMERYGRFISGDTYFAMEYGPVPSATYDLLKNPQLSRIIEFQVIDDKKIIPLREPNLNELSDSDIEAMDTIIDIYGNVPFWKRTQDSHDDAWKEAWDKRGDAQSEMMSVESIIKLLEDGDELLEHIRMYHE